LGILIDTGYTSDMFFKKERKDDLEPTMQGSLPPQVTQAPPGESKAETHTIPLKTLFEQLQSSEQGLTGQEVRKRQDTYGPNETIGVKRSSGLVQFLRLFLNPLVAYFSVLRPRYRTALLSNSFDGAREREQDRYHFAELVDFIIYSHEVGLAKPDPRIYALTSQRVGVQPQEIVFLDDAERNVAAAAASGFHAILYQNNAQAIAEIERCLQAL
jgi:putative hydrolase of the HAD superfamily